MRRIALEKKEREKQIKEERRLRYEAKKQQLREEVQLAKERELDLKRFLREEQAILRKEQAQKRKNFLEEIKLEKKIEAFRKRELVEIKNLEKLALQEEREDYKQVEERLEKITSCSELISLSLNLKSRSFFVDINFLIPSCLFKPKCSNILFCSSSKKF